MKPHKLLETSLSRVWQHIESDRPIAIMTAFRDEFSHEENIARNKALAARLKTAGYGYFFLDGHWIENAGTEDEVLVSEDSIFVIGKEGEDEEFSRLIKELGTKYNQDAVLIKDRTGITVHDLKGGDDFPLSKLRFNNIGDVYSRIRGKKDQTFMFESERDGEGFISRLRKLAGI